MLFLHEVHQVAGRREEEFEAAYRDGWMPSLAKGDDARLLYFLHHAHGTGRAYNVVTITAIRDGAAWEQLMLRLHDGDLQPWARRPPPPPRRRPDDAPAVPWSPLKDLDLAAVPTSGHHRSPCSWRTPPGPRGRAGRVPRGGARTTRPASPRAGARDGRSSSSRPCSVPRGAGRWREVVLWQKVTQLKARHALVTTEVPPEYRAGTWMHDALEVRDDWESKLLRTTAWSPMF